MPSHRRTASAVSDHKSAKTSKTNNSAFVIQNFDHDNDFEDDEENLSSFSLSNCFDNLLDWFSALILGDCIDPREDDFLSTIRKIVASLLGIIGGFCLLPAPIYYSYLAATLSSGNSSDPASFRVVIGIAVIFYILSLVICIPLFLYLRLTKTMPTNVLQIALVLLTILSICYDLVYIHAPIKTTLIGLAQLAIVTKISYPSLVIVPSFMYLIIVLVREGWMWQMTGNNNNSSTSLLLPFDLMFLRIPGAYAGQDGAERLIFSFSCILFFIFLTMLVSTLVKEYTYVIMGVKANNQLTHEMTKCILAFDTEKCREKIDEVLEAVVENYARRSRHGSLVTSLSAQRGDHQEAIEKIRKRLSLSHSNSFNPMMNNNNSNNNNFHHQQSPTPSQEATTTTKKAGGSFKKKKSSNNNDEKQKQQNNLRYGLSQELCIAFRHICDKLDRARPHLPPWIIMNLDDDEAEDFFDSEDDEEEYEEEEEDDNNNTTPGNADGTPEGKAPSKRRMKMLNMMKQKKKHGKKNGGENNDDEEEDWSNSDKDKDSDVDSNSSEMSVHYGRKAKKPAWMRGSSPKGGGLQRRASAFGGRFLSFGRGKNGTQEIAKPGDCSSKNNSNTNNNTNEEEGGGKLERRIRSHSQKKQHHHQQSLIGGINQPHSLMLSGTIVDRIVVGRLNFSRLCELVFGEDLRSHLQLASAKMNKLVSTILDHAASLDGNVHAMLSDVVFITWNSTLKISHADMKSCRFLCGIPELITEAFLCSEEEIEENKMKRIKEEKEKELLSQQRFATRTKVSGYSSNHSKYQFGMSAAGVGGSSLNRSGNALSRGTSPQNSSLSPAGAKNLLPTTTSRSPQQKHLLKSNPNSYNNLNMSGNSNPDIRKVDSASLIELKGEGENNNNEMSRNKSLSPNMSGTHHDGQQVNAARETSFGEMNNNNNNPANQSLSPSNNSLEDDDEERQWNKKIMSMQINKVLYGACVSGSAWCQVSGSSRRQHFILSVFSHERVLAEALRISERGSFFVVCRHIQSNALHEFYLRGTGCLPYAHFTSAAMMSYASQGSVTSMDNSIHGGNTTVGGGSSHGDGTASNLPSTTQPMFVAFGGDNNNNQLQPRQSSVESANNNTGSGGGGGGHLSAHYNNPNNSNNAASKTPINASSPLSLPTGAMKAPPLTDFNRSVNHHLENRTQQQYGSNNSHNTISVSFTPSSANEEPTTTSGGGTVANNNNNNVAAPRNASFSVTSNPMIASPLYELISKRNISETTGDEWLYQLHGVAATSAIGNPLGNNSTDGGGGDQSNNNNENGGDNNDNANSVENAAARQNENEIPVGLALSDVVALLARAQVHKAKGMMDRILKDEPSARQLLAYRFVEESLSKIHRISRALGLDGGMSSRRGSTAAPSVDPDFQQQQLQHHHHAASTTSTGISNHNQQTTIPQATASAEDQDNSHHEHEQMPAIVLNKSASHSTATSLTNNNANNDHQNEVAAPHQVENS